MDPDHPKHSTLVADYKHNHCQGFNHSPMNTADFMGDWSKCLFYEPMHLTICMNVTKQLWALCVDY
jgi:hypothetical protein